MVCKTRLGLALAIPLALAASPASSAGPAGAARSFQSGEELAFIKTGARTLAPFAHVKFCVRNPNECAAADGVSTMDVDATRSEQLRQVNRSVNREISPSSDRSGTGGDIWQVEAQSGDCEDYALTKRARLIALGWSPRALRIAIAFTRSGEGHAVLVVRTSTGDVVLDNRTSAIRNWRHTDLRWVKIQSGDNPRIWYNI